MTAIPPSRYKVVERGRRLVVIDTRTGQPVTHDHPRTADAGAPPSSPAAPIQQSTQPKIDDRSGSAVFTTSPIYDLKGPRRIVMNDAASGRMGKAAGGWITAAVLFVIAAFLFPFLWVLPVFALFQPKVRAKLREAVTARLDEMDQAGR